MKKFHFFIFRKRTAAVFWVCVWVSIHAVLALASEPPQYTSRTWQTDDGLPHNTVQALAQSQEGYLWVGTLAGLARFDGVRFTVFDSHNTRALTNASITALCQGRDGTLWIGTAGSGLVKMRGGHFEAQALGDNLRANTVKCILETHDGSLWVGTRGGLFHLQSGKWKHFTVNDGLTDDVVRCLFEDGDTLWIGAGSGINVYKNGIISKRNMPPGYTTASVHNIFRDLKGGLWVSFTGGLARLQGDNLTLYTKKDGLADDNVTVLTGDRRGNMWIGTYGGLSRMNEHKIIVENDNNGGYFDQVNALLEDQEGTMWVGARDGLHQLRPRRFLAYTRQQGLQHNNVTSVLEDKAGSIWIGTWGGGFAQMKDGEINNYTWENNLANGLSSDLILSMYEDRDGSLLIGTDYEGGTFRFSGGKFTRVWSKKESQTNRVVRVIYRDTAGNLWFGASPGLLLADSKDRFLDLATIRSITEDRTGALLVGSNDGLFRREGKRFERLNLPGGLNHETILALYADKENTLWIGTEKEGLGCWKAGRYKGYTTKDGLWSDEVFEILEDDRGYLWMSCTRGVFRVSKANLLEVDQGNAARITSIAYGKADGMESIQCSGVSKPAGWKARDGRLWFATTKGVVVTDPNAADRYNEKPPIVRIEEVVTDKKVVAVTDGTNRILLKPGGRDLEFHYTALSLVVPERNRFRYKLAGVDPGWVDAGSRRVAYYNNLPPGDYEFQVMAANNDGVWSPAEARLGVKLEPHLWQAWWFSGVAAIAVAGIIGGAVRNATKTKLQRKLQVLEQQHVIETERTRIARDMHDDLGARLTEIMLLNELAQKNVAHPENLLTQLDKQSSVIQDAAGSVDAIVWAVNPVNDSLDRLANYLYAQAERLLAMRFIHCRFDVPDQLPDYSLSSDVRHNVYLAVRETLNNIIKHSGASEVWFRLRVTPAALSIVIEDNGGGFSAEDRGSAGNGLHNIEKRMKNLGGSFNLVTKPGAGTCIQLEVPIKTDPKV